jgi:hypothetical protein
MLSEMYKLQELTEKDQRTKQKVMQMMLSQEHEERLNRFYNKLKPTKNKLSLKLKVKQVDF